MRTYIHPCIYKTLPLPPSPSLSLALPLSLSLSLSYTQIFVLRATKYYILRMLTFSTHTTVLQHSRLQLPTTTNGILDTTYFPLPPQWTPSSSTRYNTATDFRQARSFVFFFFSFFLFIVFPTPLLLPLFSQSPLTPAETTFSSSSQSTHTTPSPMAPTREREEDDHTDTESGTGEDNEGIPHLSYVSLTVHTSPPFILHPTDLSYYIPGTFHIISSRE
jgi:hypothetical protein